MKPGPELGSAFRNVDDGNIFPFENKLFKPGAILAESGSESLRLFCRLVFAWASKGDTDG